MKDESYLRIIDNMVWSYSRIKCYEECPYRFFLRYIYECDKEEKFYASYGSYVHKLIEQYYNSEGKLSNSDMVYKYLSGFFVGVKGEIPSESIIDKYLKCGVDYFRNIKPFNYQKVSVEEHMEFQIDGLNFVGIIDFLGTDGEGFHIIDHKSRDLKPRSNRKKPTMKDNELDSMLRQLYVYSAGVKEKYGKFPKTLCFNCFKSGVFIEEPFSEEAYNEAIKWVKNEIKWIREDDGFSPKIDYFQCRYLCDCSKECCYVQWR